MAFSQNGNLVAASLDLERQHTIAIWDTTTGFLNLTLEPGPDETTAVSFSPDGRQVVSGSYDGTPRLWNTASEDVQETPDMRISRDRYESETVCHGTMSPNGRLMALVRGDITIDLWDISTGDLLWTLEAIAALLEQLLLPFR